MSELKRAPFPLEGGRAGDGGGDASAPLGNLVGRDAAAQPATPQRREVATPIPGPSPLQGEARRPHGPISGGVERARRLRRESTLAERLLWAELRKLKLNIRRQAPIGRYVADFVSHAAKLVIEVDGPIHDETERAVRDAERTAWLNAQGYRVIRFAEADVRNRLFDIDERIAAEAAPPPSPTLPPSRGKGDARYIIR